MKYPYSVSGSEQHDHAGHADAHTYRQEYGSANVPVVRRFPPSLQFLTRAEQSVEAQLQAIAIRTFNDGKTLDQICGALYQAGLSLGYRLTIGLQEVYSSKMPSFPGQTVMTSLIMVDFTSNRPKAQS